MSVVLLATCSQWNEWGFRPPLLVGNRLDDGHMQSRTQDVGCGGAFQYIVD